MGPQPIRQNPGFAPVSSPDTQVERNWNELLQELRVTQTGVQILTGFLLTLPFTQRFAALDGEQRLIYLATIIGSVAATGLIIAPVAFHRLLFHHQQRPWLVEAADTMAKAGLVLLAMTTSGVILLVFDVVVSRGVAYLAAIATLGCLMTVWAGIPLVAHRTNGRQQHQ
jgi:hypothetical protein